ncbi:glycosyltransferase [Gemmiger formicilis]|nr:glycosyltransferase [Gemmiger formicilis]
MTPAVSVIVPVYKAEATLDACVESILRRRSRTLSCCSSTTKARTAARKCAMPGQKDPRIRVLHPAKAGPGPSGARNAGCRPPRPLADDGGQRRHDSARPCGKAAGGRGDHRRRAGDLQRLPVTEDGARHPLPADEQFTKDTLLDVDAFWDAFHTPWINQFTGTAHRLYAARLLTACATPWACCMRITTCCRI